MHYIPLAPFYFFCRLTGNHVLSASAIYAGSIVISLLAPTTNLGAAAFKAAFKDKDDCRHGGSGWATSLPHRLVSLFNHAPTTTTAPVVGATSFIQLGSTVLVVCLLQVYKSLSHGPFNATFFPHSNLTLSEDRVLAISIFYLSSYPCRFISASVGWSYLLFFTLFDHLSRCSPSPSLPLYSSLL
jgi:hypothetical protein